jgi:hypothetical protein
MKGKLIGWTAAGLAGVGLFAGVADAAGNGSTPASSAADVAHPHIGQRAIARVEHRLLAGAVRGELVLDPKKGAQIVDFQRGMTSDASSGAVTVTDKTGTAQSWTVTSSTKIRERGASSPKLTDGENVVVVGLKSAGALTARLIVVVPRQAQPTT